MNFISAILLMLLVAMLSFVIVGLARAIFSNLSANSSALAEARVSQSGETGNL